MAKKATICLLLLGSVLLLCAPAWGACTTDDDCLYPGGIALECVDGECVNPNLLGDADNTGIDQPISSLTASSYDVRCESGLDGECPTAYECNSEGLCVRRSCSSDDDCGSAAYYCGDEGFCQPIACTWDSDCPTYYICVVPQNTDSSVQNLNPVCIFNPVVFLEAGGGNCRSLPQGASWFLLPWLLGIMFWSVRRRKARPDSSRNSK